ncbi:MAG: hypothetical protein QOE93_24 [Actinomycetota bacterium]|nr:hypothetical protein [Actinomycetota bacterium]
MAAKKKGPGKGRGPATRPPSPAKRTTVPKPGAPKDPTAAGGQAPPAAGAKAPAPKPATPAGARPGGTAKLPPPTKSGGGSTARQGGTTAKPGGATAKLPSPSPTKAGGGATAKPPSLAKATGGPSAKATGGTAAKATGGTTAKARQAGGGGAPAKASAPAAAKAAPGAKNRPRTGPTREERLAAAAAARRRRSIRNKALLAGAVAVAIFAVGLVIQSDRRERDQQAAQFTTASCQFDRDSDDDAGSGRNHVPNPTYEVNPPAGGDHTPQAAGAGIFTAENAPADGPTVHALEHGYIVLWYRPDLDESSLTMLRDLAQKHAKDVLVVPRAMEVPVAATAWHARVLCGAVETSTLELFITEFANGGPEKVAH